MSKLTFFGSRGAPNPRRVEIFLAEHGLAEGEGYNYVQIDMSKGEHKAGGKYATPNQKTPMLQYSDADGVFELAESVAMCRFIEEEVASNSSVCLFGTTPRERSVIEFWNRRIELEFFSAVGKAWINGPVLVELRKLRGLEGHESELQLGLASAQSFLKEMDQELGKRSYVAGHSFSLADITLLCVLDFAAGPVFVPMHWDKWANLAQWHKTVSSRSSVVQNKNPHVKGLHKYGEYKDNGVWRPRPSQARL